MGYYDSVKDSIRDNNDDDEGGKMNSGSGNFDTLKQNAEETSEDEDKGDETPIEVLEEDGLKRESSSKKSSESSSSDKGNPLTSENSDSTASTEPADMTGVEDKLDKIIDQNERMIEILESFGQ